MKPADFGLPAKFLSFRSYPGFDQLAVAQDIARGFEDIGIRGGIEHRFQMLQAATGCLAGDTKIQIARGSGIRVSNKISMAEEFRLQHGSRRRPHIKSYTRSLVDGFLRHQPVKEVVYSGVRETFLLETGRGDRLRATADHEVLTTGGFVPLAELDGSSRIVVDVGIRQKDKLAPKVHYRVVQLRYHPFAGHAQSRRPRSQHRYPEGRLYRVALHRAVVEADMNGIPLAEFLDICRNDHLAVKGLKFLDPLIYAVHHRDGNAKNNDLENLEVLTHSDHARAHDPIQHLRHQVEDTTLSRIARYGREDTYDLIIENGEPNFVANGIVVHNSGKSLTSATVAALLAREKPPEDGPFRWLVLTGTKGLQQQYMADELAQCSVVGHRNYPCMPSYQRLALEAEDPDDPEFRCLAIPRDTCGYTIDTTRTRESSGVAGVVGNYAHWLSLGRYSDPRLLGDFDLVVLDEAHSSPEWLTRAMQIYLNPYAIGKVLGINGPYRMPVPAPARIEDWGMWLVKLLAEVDDRYEDLMAAKDVKGAARAHRLAKELALLRIAASPEDREFQRWTEPWVVIPQDQRPGYVFSPRWGADFAERYLFRDIPRVLLTSATVTPQHAKQLGIAPDQMRFREVPSPFDPRRRPVIWVPTTRVDFRMTDGQRWLLMRRIDQVIEAAITEGAGNGLIHSVSYEWADQIKRESAYSAAILTHKKDSAEFQAALERFKGMGRAGQFAVMCSPRMVEGVDLPDVLCGWQVIVKCPFPDTQDPLEKLRAKDQGYRDLVVAMKITQMVGRPVRGIDDFATTFVFDDHWGQHVAKQCPFAQWMRAAFRTGRPDPAGKGNADGNGKVEIAIELLTREKVEKLGPMPVVMAPQVVQFLQP